ncbi:MAG: hypothetical protein PVJ67_06565 [Candidatus Pacearchaeota archaeon]|jgi:predicted transcriptional regulator
MGKRTFKEIRNQILREIKKVRECSYGYLERKVNTNWQTIRDHVENLEFFGVVEITKDKKVRLKG